MATIRLRTARAVAALAAAGLVLAGCGTATSSMSATDPGADHNRADVTFAARMVPHHEMAVHMADMAQWHDASPALTDLAEHIEQAQQPEIDRMQGWLDDWGEDADGWAGPGSMMGGRGYGPGMMGDRDGDYGPGMMRDWRGGFGMMSGRGLRSLDGTAAEAFVDGWLRMMIRHHQGAIRMARTEIAKGEYPPALDLARSIASSQQAEIEQMRQMLDG